MSAAVAELSQSPYALSEQEIASWHENGFLGPYTAWTPEEAAEMREIIFRHMDRPSNIYGFHCLRDRHLDSSTKFKYCTHPALVERCAGILGPDLVFWRSNYFRKLAGAGPIAWHRGNDFKGIRGIPAIIPATNITCWLALTDANKANGCVQLIPGSHKRQDYSVEKDSSGGGVFGRGKAVKGIDTSSAVYMEVKAGQFFFFNELTLHGSDPNTSNSERTGTAVRITSAATRIYPDQKVDGQGMSLKNWHGILVRGEDKYGYNKLGPPPKSDNYSFGPVKSLMGRLGYLWQHYKYGLELKKE